MEEFKVSGEKLKDRLKELIREGNVRRVILKNPAGRVLLDMPLNAGVVGVALLPFWAAVAAIAVLAIVSVIAVGAPAIKAARIAPVDALRGD